MRSLQIRRSEVVLTEAQGGCLVAPLKTAKVNKRACPRLVCIFIRRCLSSSFVALAIILDEVQSFLRVTLASQS